MSTHSLFRMLKVLVTIAICSVSAGCLVNHAVTVGSGALIRGEKDSLSSKGVGAVVLANAQSGSKAKTQEPLRSGIAEQGSETAADITAANVIKYWLLAAGVALIIVVLSLK